MIGVVIALVASRRTDTAFPAGSPDGKVAEFLRLVENSDLDDAYRLTDIPGMSREKFEERFRYGSQTSRRITLVRSETEGATATVVVDSWSLSRQPPVRTVTHSV
ncbi:MAG: hypothetical protein WKH64_14125 [Chloroflexia bacterium]